MRFNPEPDLDFRYADADTFAAETAELYTYSEMEIFSANAQAFRNYAERKKV